MDYKLFADILAIREKDRAIDRQGYELAIQAAYLIGQSVAKFPTRSSDTPPGSEACIMCGEKKQHNFMCTLLNVSGVLKVCQQCAQGTFAKQAFTPCKICLDCGAPKFGLGFRGIIIKLCTLWTLRSAEYVMYHITFVKENGAVVYDERAGVHDNKSPWLARYGC